jgi:hypothetical protein
MSEGVRNSAVATVVVAVLAVAAELIFVDRDHLEATIWGASVPGMWALLGLAAAVGLTLLAVALGMLLQLQRDPYGGGGGDG